MFLRKRKKQQILQQPQVVALEEKQKSFGEKVCSVCGIGIYLTLIPLWLDVFLLGHVSLSQAIWLTPMIVFIGWFFRF
ncbi:MAG: hypothetical protein V1652_00050 [bacterium]